MQYRIIAAFAAAFLLFDTAAACTRGTRHDALVKALEDEFPEIAIVLESMCADRAVLTPPSPIKTWGELEAVVLAPENVLRAQELFEREYPALQCSYKRFGIPLNYIMAILMVESLGGTHLGHYPVLVTLYNKHEYGNATQRQSARGQLRSFLRARPWEMCRCGTVYDLKGSSAGALGLPQFMPYAIEHHGVDGDGDGIINLFALPDAASSVAKHLSDNGWRRDRRAAIEMYNHHPRYREVVENVAARFASFKPPAERPRGPVLSTLMRCMP
jgi:membrane-bound lytic murein transglycosylase B